jgi:Domain of unknown function (DUF397)
MDESPEGPLWRKSNYCNSSSCVEAALLEDRVLLRDSKVRNGLTLQFSFSEWRAFLNGVRDGEFDLA